MLVLGRKQGEAIRISTDRGNIDITIARIVGSTVRVGVTAPEEMRITRIGDNNEEIGRRTT